MVRAQGLIEPLFPLAAFQRVLFVAASVALAGAVYAAVRATRLWPMAARRDE